MMGQTPRDSQSIRQQGSQFSSVVQGEIVLCAVED